MPLFSGTDASTTADGKDSRVDTSAGDKNLGWVSTELKVGDFCRATYREDGVDYEAVVVSIDPHGNCLIKFLGYGNEQYTAMKELVASWGEEFRLEQIEAATQDESCLGTSADDLDSNASTLNSDREAEQNFIQTKAHGHGNKKRKGRAVGPPPMPPMPPGTGDESLHAMLMAWYMSGYYTGVYDAQQKSRKK